MNMPGTAATMLLLALLFALHTEGTAGDNPHNVWTLETKEDVETKYFLQDGKYFFVRAEDWLHFFDGENGKELWKVRVPDYEKKGLHVLWEECTCCHASGKRRVATSGWDKH